MATNEMNLFISHSPLDKDVLIKLKNEILKRSSGDIKIFLSSDGQSIPLGTNWQKELDSALENCKLMLVAVTPRSNDSKWIQFESGYAYAKGCKVIPFAYDGMTIDTMGPPLNRMQGFNLDCPEKFQNIIREINTVFALSLCDEISDEDFSKITQSDNEIANSFYEFGVILLHLTIPYYANWATDYNRVLTELGSQCAVDQDTIRTHGLTIRHYGSDTIRLTLDPSVLNAHTNFLNQVIKQGSMSADVNIELEYGNGYSELDIPEWITSRLNETEISFSQNGLIYRNCGIKISHGNSFSSNPIKQSRTHTIVNLSFKDLRMQDIDLEHLIHILNATGVIYRTIIKA